MATDDDRKKANRRLGLILASVAIVFFLGFIARMALFRG
ncbi:MULTISPECIES: cytochrome oxidase small assembly protein [Ramlibacter]|nr:MULTISPECIES: cytochrome oxidase small assembly protein [Ramlibacter]